MASIRHLRRKSATPTEAGERSLTSRAFSRPELYAMVAEDSITARIFLTRMLEQRGFTVHTVATAAALLSEIERVSWALICADIELPDGSGRDMLLSLLDRQTKHCPDAAVVVLIRDSLDRAAAAKAGISRTLRKPFDRDELEQLLGRLGLGKDGQS